MSTHECLAESSDFYCCTRSPHSDPEHEARNMDGEIVASWGEKP